MKTWLPLALLAAVAALSYWMLSSSDETTPDSHGRDVAANEVQDRPGSTTPPPFGRQVVPEPTKTDIEEPDGAAAAERENATTSAAHQESVASFANDYAGWSAQQLNTERGRLQHQFLQERTRIFDELREARVVTETTLSTSGAVPKPPDSFEHGMYQTVVNPSEADHQPGDPMTVWFVHAARDSYPELYALRDRVRWLQQQ